jgi:membrane protease YdiL (CAAX protease family)
MQSDIKRLPAAAEFAIVLVLAFGFFVYTSLHHYFGGHWGTSNTDAGKLGTIAIEVVSFALAGSFLWARGWTLERIGLKITARDTLIGLVLGAATYVIYRGLAIAVSLVPEWHGIFFIGHGRLSHITLPVIGLVLVINSIFEEVFAAGYLISFLKPRFGASVAVNAGLFLRVLYHLYQGVGAILHVVPVSLVFGIWYARTRRLWPLIVAHATINAFVYGRALF